MIHFVCPHCSLALEADDDLGGVRIRCWNCQQEIAVPGAALPGTETADAPLAVVDGGTALPPPVRRAVQPSGDGVAVANRVGWEAPPAASSSSYQPVLRPFSIWSFLFGVPGALLVGAGVSIHCLWSTSSRWSLIFCGGCWCRAAEFC